MAVRGKKAGTLPIDKAPKPKRQPNLPGMEDNKIAELEAAALEYADGRDERMEMTKREVELKTLLLGLMRKHGKKTYKCGEIEIRVVPKDEMVKVKIHKPKEPSDLEEL